MIEQGGKVSVIIPVYNGEKYIEETLNSILQSIYQNLEVLFTMMVQQTIVEKFVSIFNRGILEL